MNTQSCIYAFHSGAKMIHLHYFTEFKKKETVMKCFGVGLGDQAVMLQLGQAFLDNPDPELGNISVSFGTTTTALKPWKGDFNVWWAWGDRPDWINYYLHNTSYKPDLCLCPSFEVKKQIVEAGLYGIYCPLATGTVFHPLNLKRSGLGYAGLDSKSDKQKELTISNYLERLEWHGRDSWTTLDKLNEFYNRKAALFGMINELSLSLEALPNRVFETLASDTPLIFPKHPGFMELFKKEYPWQTSSADETAKFVEEILADYPVASEKAQTWGKLVREEHSYESRLNVLFSALKELKR